MIRIVCLIIGYVIGLFQTAYILGRMNGIDIRKHGSGNLGTTNMLRTKGLKAGLTVLLIDLLKCIIAVILISLIFGKSYPDMIMLLRVYAAAGVVLGHDFPFYLGFKGGKGIAATAGFIIAMSYFNIIYFVMGVLVFFGIFFTTHYVSLGSIMVYITLVIETIIFGQMGIFNMEQNYLNEMYVIIALMAVLAIFLHRENIKRLIKGEERKTYLKKKSDE